MRITRLLLLATFSGGLLGAEAPAASATTSPSVIDDKRKKPPRPPRPPTPPRPPQGRSGFDDLRKKLADRTPGRGVGRDRLRDRRFWGQNLDNGAKKKKADAGEPTEVAIDPADVEAMRDAVAKTRKRLEQKQRRARATLKRAGDPATVEAKVEQFKLDYYDQLAALLKECDESAKSKATVPASLAALEAPEAVKREKPARDSFEDLRDRFLAAETKGFIVSSRSAKNPGVKALYEKLRYYAEARRHAEPPKAKVKEKTKKRSS